MHRAHTGRSVYVEPSGVVELTNELGMLREKLRQEESSILNNMCRYDWWDMVRYYLYDMV